MTETADRIVPGRWLVTLHPQANTELKSTHMTALATRTADETPFSCHVNHQFDLPETRGYSASFDDATRVEIEKLHEVKPYRI